MIPQSFIQDLLSRVDIVDVIERHLTLKKGGANYFACCPFHGEKTPSFSISPAKQFYHCFGCGVHGNAIGFLMEYSGLSFIEAVTELARQIGVEVPRESGTSAPQIAKGEQDALLEAMNTAARFYREQLKHHPAAVDYLKRRGLTGEIAARFGIGYAPDGWQALAEAFPAYDAKALLEAGLVIENEAGRRYDRFRDRIMFPIQDRRGRIIAFGGRIIGEGEPKYLNSPETPLFEKGRELYGLTQAQQAIRENGFVLVVEGYMDVVSLAQYGVGNAVATLGTATTPAHLKSLLRFSDRIVFCFDGDKAGRKAAWRALEASLESLRDDATLAFLLLPEKHDPDSFVRAEGAEALLKAAASATPLAAFLLSELSTDIDLGSAEGRARLVHDAAPLIRRIAAPVLKLQLTKQVAELAGMTQAEVESVCGLAVPLRPPARDEEPPPWSGSRPARPPQHRRPRPTSPIAALLRLALQHPGWLARLPVDLVPGDDEHGRALIALIDAMSIGDVDPTWGLGTLVERFRNTPHGDTLSAVAAELVDSDYDEATAEDFLEDTVRKLQIDAIEREIRAVTERIRTDGHDAEARQRLKELFVDKRNLSESSKTKNL